MKAALAVLEIQPAMEANLDAVLTAIEEAARLDAGLVLFPEAVLTGLVNDDDPAHDLPLGVKAGSRECERIRACARARRIAVGFGFLERQGARLFDSAVLFDSAGALLLHYRRVHPGWHGRAADPSVYARGDAVLHADTAFGRVVLLLCGDLFDDDVLAQARALEPDLLLFPFWRCFDDLTHDDARWLCEEQPEYAERAASTGATTLMVNALAPGPMEGGAFGGALVVTPDARVVARQALGKAGLLVVDVGAVPAR